MADLAQEFVMNKSVHSDFLIHWTGLDIDQKYDKEWWINKSKEPNRVIIPYYLERLKYILKYGLWMNEEKNYIEVTKDGNKHKIKIPLVARTCFTELRLSEVRFHAQKFGRLGIGFKRMFVFNRLGNPLFYFRPEKENWLLPPFLYGKQQDGVDEFYSCFLKSMDEEQKEGNLLGYKQFDESEWRIIYSEDIEKRFIDLKRSELCDFFIRPGEIKDPEFHKYIKENDRDGKLRFLIHLKSNKVTAEILDKWVAMIIYPNIAVKVESEFNPGIRKLIEVGKPKRPDPPSKGSAGYEQFNKPIEIDLDACRNF